MSWWRKEWWGPQPSEEVARRAKLPLVRALSALLTGALRLLPKEPSQPMTKRGFHPKWDIEGQDGSVPHPAYAGRHQVGAALREPAVGEISGDPAAGGRGSQPHEG